jgi:hypothetical protein
MFNKRHYELFATALKHAPTLSDFVEDMCVIFRNDNPKFDEKRFRKACGRVKYDE